MEAELLELLGQYADSKDEQGRQMIVRNGYLPAREIQTGIGAVKVKVPKVRDRSGSGVCFHSSLLPPYLRRTKSMEELLPWLYLKGLSTGDFQEALAALTPLQLPGLAGSAVFSHRRPHGPLPIGPRALHRRSPPRRRAADDPGRGQTGLRRVADLLHDRAARLRDRERELLALEPHKDDAHRRDGVLAAAAEGWHAHEWHAVAERITELTHWSMPTIPGPDDPGPFDGSPSLG